MRRREGERERKNTDKEIKKRIGEKRARERKWEGERGDREDEIK